MRYFTGWSGTTTDNGWNSAGYSTSYVSATRCQPKPHKWFHTMSLCNWMLISGCRAHNLQNIIYSLQVVFFLLCAVIVGWSWCKWFLMFTVSLDKILLSTIISTVSSLEPLTDLALNDFVVCWCLLEWCPCPSTQKITVRGISLTFHGIKQGWSGVSAGARRTGFNKPLVSLL